MVLMIWNDPKCFSSHLYMTVKWFFSSCMHAISIFNMYAQWTINFDKHYLLTPSSPCNAIVLGDYSWLIVGFISQLDTWIQMNALIFQPLKNVMKNLSRVISYNEGLEHLMWQAVYDCKLHLFWIWVTQLSKPRMVGVKKKVIIIINIIINQHNN